jgi:hypothetical protein
MMTGRFDKREHAPWGRSRPGHGVVVRPHRKADVRRDSEAAGTGGKAVVMAVHEQRLKKLRAHVTDAHDELHALPDKERNGNKTGLARLDEVIGYAGVVLEGAEAPLVSTRAFTTLESAACTISNNPRAALRQADACADALLDAVAMLPVRGEDVEAERQRVEAFRSDVDQLASALARQIEHQAAVESKLAGIDQAIAKKGQALDAQMARLSNELAEGRHEHAAALQGELDEFCTTLAQAQKQAFDEVEGSVAEIKRMEMESAALVGSIGLAGAAELYHEQGRRQRRAAEILRGLTVLTALASVAVAVTATAGTQPTVESLIGNLFASLLLAGLAAYLALQSERHRARERQASALHLDLVAFSPFIEALPPEQRTEERVIVTRKLFAKSVPGLTSLEGPATTGAMPEHSGAPNGPGSGDRQNGHVPA